MKTLRRIAAMALCSFGLTAGDNLWAQYQKIVFLEDFSSVTCVNCPQAAEIVKKIAKENPERVLTAQWHLDIPGRNDPFYAANKPHNEGRAKYYNNGALFNALPQVFVDGGSSVGTNEATVRADINDALSQEAPIGITVTHTKVEGGNTVNVRVSIESEDGLPNGYRLYAIAVEGMVHRSKEYFTQVAKSQPYYDETEFRDLFRTFVSPAEGVEVDLAGGDKNYDYTYTIGNDWAAEEMYVIAWVQDEFSGEITQAGSSPKPASLSVKEEKAMAGYSLALPVPNPATVETRVLLTLGNSEEGTVTLHNTQGELAKEISLGRMEAGEHEVDIQTGDLPAGVYTLTVQAGEYRASQKLTVIK